MSEFYDCIKGHVILIDDYQSDVYCPLAVFSVYPVSDYPNERSLEGIELDIEQLNEHFEADAMEIREETIGIDEYDDLENYQRFLACQYVVVSDDALYEELKPIKLTNNTITESKLKELPSWPEYQRKHVNVYF